jgi:hypothetical protein
MQMERLVDKCVIFSIIVVPKPLDLNQVVPEKMLTDEQYLSAEK